MKKINEKKKFQYVIVLILIFGSILRFYNVNFDDFWSDEMVSFWVTDPNIEFSKTMQRIFSSNWMVLYEIGLKYFHFLFGYEVNISRYFSVAISILSLIAFAALLNKITNKKAVIFGLFLLSINIYHLGFSIELRSYILSFLLVILFIYLSFKEDFYKNNFVINIITLNVLLILMLLCHPFTLLVVGSLIFYEIIKTIKEKKFNRLNFFFIFSLTLVTVLFLIFYFQTTLKIIDENVLKGISPDWMWQVKPSFYTNFYFSKFFGSRILGLIYLITLIGCIIKFYKKITTKFNIYTFFLILFIFSYLIPLTYGYIFNPILLDRYIFFILIPIICLLSHLIFEIKLKKIRIFLIFLILASSFLNNLLYENSFKKFYTEIYPTKPEIKKALNLINSSDIKKYTFKEDNRYSINTNKIIENYLVKFNQKLNFASEYIPFDNINFKPEKIWVIYLKDTINKNFEVPDKFKNYKIEEKKFLNRLELYLISL